MFNTLGNLVVDPACGLTVIDPDDGTTLYLSRRGDRRRRPPRDPESQDRVVHLDQRRPAALVAGTLGRYPSSA